MDLRKQLGDADPVGREPEMDAFHAQAMRQRVVLAARHAGEREGFSRAWIRPLALATAIAACLVAGVAVGLRINERQPVASPAAVRPDATRQLQFAAPGGTRIIWTFNQEFDL